MVRIFSSGLPSNAVLAFFSHARATVSSPPTMASSERNSRTNSTASSNGLVPRSSRNSCRRMRETVASETPMTEASILAVMSRRSAARSVALVKTAFSAALAAILGCITDMVFPFLWEI